MSEYKRWICYLYYYVNGVRQGSAGAARIERRGHDCRITASIRISNFRENAVSAYFLLRTSNDVYGLPIGEVSLSENGIDWNVTLPADDIAGSGMKLEQMDGLVICANESKYLASAWSEEQITLSEVHKILRTDLIPESTGQEDEEAETELQHEDMTEGEPRQQREYTTEGEQRLQREHTVDEKGEPENDITAQETGSRSCDMTAMQRMFRHCREIYPFYESCREKCIKLELTDIGLLPPGMWQLTGNSFLMHSYYGYRHLVLSCSSDESEEEYSLLVPGIYTERERKLAEQFGFEKFRCARGGVISAGEFGYWSMPVKSET